MVPVSRLAPSLLAVAAAAALVACGSDGTQPATTSAATAAPRLAPVKDYLLERTASLERSTGQLESLAERYNALARAAGFDYRRLLAEHRPEVASILRQAQTTFRKANPSYESMEGIVAGVPELADYDVLIDAGTTGADDPQNAAPITLKTRDGRTFEKPGNYFYVAETALWGTEPQFAAKGASADLDADGTEEFGEALPDADVLLTAMRGFHKAARDLEADAKRWTPNDSDVFTAMVVMTPTMSEYFNTWKNTRAVAGAGASEKAFVATSRLSDITDILSSLEVVYGGVRPRVAAVDAAQARQTGRGLSTLRAYSARLRDQEAAGKRFTAEDADTLGTEAQRRAEAIAGQISQAAARLGVQIEE